MKIETISEIGQAHDGSLGIAHSFIDALAGTGVDTIKFQVHIAEAESSKYEPFRTNFSFLDNTRYDYWKRVEFNKEQWQGLKKHCEEKGMEFLASPFSNAAVNLLESIGVKRYKIGSGEVNNFLILNKIAQTKKPIILSSGMSSFEELQNSIDYLKTFNATISILQCTTAYPTMPEQWGLNVICELKQKFGLKTGFSDHSGDIFASLAAAALGAEIIEFHATFDKSMFGPDAESSLTINETKKLITGLKQIETALNFPSNKEQNDKYNNLKSIFEKSLAVNKKLQAGHIIQVDDLEAKKPKNKGVNADKFEDVVGKQLLKPLNKWDFLNNTDIK